MSERHDDFMAQQVRIYHENYVTPEEKNYFSMMSGLGPAFGATRDESPIMSRGEALKLTARFSMFVDWGLEIVEGAKGEFYPCKPDIFAATYESAESASAPDRAEELAREFHETYERLAPQFGYETRKESAKPWAEVPEPNKQLMIAVCAHLLQRIGKRGADEISSMRVV